MKSHRFKLAVIIVAGAAVVTSYFAVANAYRTKIVTERVDSRINIEDVIRQIEEVYEAKSVSAIRNMSSFWSQDKIDRIKVKMMTNQGSEEGVLWRGIGHVWMSGSKSSDLVMVRLMDTGDVKVTRLYTSLPSSPNNKKPNKAEMATPNQPSD